MIWKRTLSQSIFDFNLEAVPGRFCNFPKPTIWYLYPLDAVNGRLYSSGKGARIWSSLSSSPFSFFHSNSEYSIMNAFQERLLESVCHYPKISTISHPPPLYDGQLFTLSSSVRNNYNYNYNYMSSDNMLCELVLIEHKPTIGGLWCRKGPE